MTSKIGSAATAKVVQRITGPSGVNAGLGALTQADREFAGLVDSSQVRAQNVAAEMAERALGVKYPAVNVYCEKIVNDLREKFRSVLGPVQMAIELRQSQDRLEGIQDRLELYVDATMQMLNGSRGDWGDGMFYGGGYEVAFGPVKAGREEFHAGGQGHFRDRSEQELVCLHIFHPTQTGSTRRWRVRTEEWNRSRPPTGFRRSSSAIQQQVETGTRRDKTGSRTFAGLPAGVRRRTTFDLQTYLTSWDKTTAGPGYGPLFQAALGAAPLRFGGGTVASSTAAGRLAFGAPHGLTAGQAVCVRRRDPVRGGDRGCAARCN